MEEFTINQNEYSERCKQLAENALNQGEHVKALTFLQSALKQNPDYQTYAQIADVYAHMELFELSNKYWFLYMDKAPLEKRSVAYEALALNLYYLDCPIECNYYLHKKIVTDGELSNERLTEEDVENFMDAFSPVQNYHVAYPFENADYSLPIKKAKKALSIGDFDQAVDNYQKVPKGAKEYAEAQRDLAAAYFLSGDTVKGIEILRDLVKQTGGDLCSYCNLASMYKYESQLEKSRLNYAFALNFEPKNLEERFKLATCALEQNDAEVAGKHIQIVLKERPYEISLKTFYAQMLINRGEYAQAQQAFNELCNINPDCDYLRYYFNLCHALVDGGEGAKAARKLLPLNYVEGLPKEEFDLRAKKISELKKLVGQKRVNALKKQENFQCIKWGLTCGDLDIQRDSAFVAPDGGKKYEQLLVDALVTPDYNIEVKHVLTFVLLRMGRRKKFSVVSNNIFTEVQPKKLAFMNTPGGEVFMDAYCLCVSKMLFMGEGVSIKIAFSADKIYKKFKNDELIFAYDVQEIAALMGRLSVKEKVVPSLDIAKLFDVKEKRLHAFKSLYEGDK